MTPYLLVECSDWDEIYRVLIFQDKIKATDIQNEIYRIKQKFYDEEYDSWCIDDLLEELSKIYDFTDLGDPLYLEC